MFHLHENVHENEYDEFVRELPEELARLAKLQGKDLSFSICHVEDVKSYAPKVHHFVFDIVCTPNIYKCLFNTI